MITLNLLQRGQSAKIIRIDHSLLSDVDAKLSLNIEQKLLEMGFIEGATVKLLHLGLGGQPMAFRINNNNNMISVRALEASMIEVAICANC